MGESGMSPVAFRVSAGADFISSEKQPEIRPVGTMTVAAFSLNNRWVPVLVILVSEALFRILMTSRAYFFLSCLLQAAFVRAMWAMAICAENASPHMGVDFSEVLLNRCVAGSTHRHPLAFYAQGVS